MDRCMLTPKHERLSIERTECESHCHSGPVRSLTTVLRSVHIPPFLHSRTVTPCSVFLLCCVLCTHRVSFLPFRIEAISAQEWTCHTRAVFTILHEGRFFQCGRFWPFQKFRTCSGSQIRGGTKLLVQGTKFSTGNLFITYTGARSSKKTYVNAFASVNQTGSKRRFSLNDPNAFGRLGQPWIPYDE